MSKFKDIVIFDLDGCLFDDEWRLCKIAMVGNGVRDYSDYHKFIEDDEPLPESKERLLDVQRQGLALVVITARPRSAYTATMAVLRKHFPDIPFESHDFDIFMRPDDDKSSSADYKRSCVQTLKQRCLAQGVNIVAAFDDRQDVIKMYLEEDVPAYILDKEGSNAPGAYKDFRFCLFRGNRLLTLAQGPGRVDPVEDGPTQPQVETPPNRERDAGDVLREALATYYDRRSTYGVAHVKFGEVMAALFPDGIALESPEDHAMFHMVGHIVGKLVRFAGSGLKDQDSILDIVTYAALAEVLIKPHNIKVGKPS